MHASRCGSDQPLDARQHFLRGAAGEGQQKDSLRRHSAREQMRDTMDQRPRLSRARAGDNEQRTPGVRRRGQLRRIQPIRERMRRCRFERARASRVEARDIV